MIYCETRKIIIIHCETKTIYTVKHGRAQVQAVVAWALGVCP